MARRSRSDRWRECLLERDREALRRIKMPSRAQPMLATLTDDRFSSADWIYERKLDGERCVVVRRGNKVHLLSRTGRDLNATYPELVEAMRQQPYERFIVDGEVVAFSGKRTSFARLQARIGLTDAAQVANSRVKVHLYLFDLLYLDQYELKALPLRTRKTLLRKSMRFGHEIRYTPHRNELGEDMFKTACDKGWEGLIAKRADSAYVPKRSRDWLKFKCDHRQELIIAGYTEPCGSRSGFGALLLAYYNGERLHFAGKVGTGFDQRTLEQLSAKLKPRVQSSCPFERRPRGIGKRVHWMTPKLVAEIGFTEWTRDGRLRHPRFLGLRRDKSAASVTRERSE